MKRIFQTSLLSLALIFCVFFASCGTAGTDTPGNTDTPADVEILDFSLGYLTESDYNDGNYSEEALTGDFDLTNLAVQYMVIDFKIKTLTQNSGNKSVKISVYTSDTSVLKVAVQEAPTGKFESVENGDGLVGYELLYTVPENAGEGKSVKTILKFSMSQGGCADVSVSVSGGTDTAVKEETALKKSVSNLVFEWQSSGGSYAVVGVTGFKHSEFVIPSTYMGKPVTSIDEKAFAGNADLKSISIPDSVTYIDGAFANCTGLTSITVPNSVTQIDRDTFKNCCSLEYISLPFVGYAADDTKSSDFLELSYIFGSTGVPASLKTVVITGGTRINNSAFYGCSSLTSITIPDSVTSIGSHAFYGCSSLTSITIPKSVTSIGNCAFNKCTGLTSITIPDSVISIGESAFNKCTNLTGAVYENAVYLGNKTNPYLFLWKATDQSITSCNVHENTKIIGNLAFDGCTALTSLRISDSVTSIATSALDGCDNLTGTEYDNAVYLGNETHPYLYLLKAVSDSISSCSIHGTTKFIGDSAFKNCYLLTDITIPDSVIGIGESAFDFCSGLQGTVYGNAKYLGNENNPYIYLLEAIDDQMTNTDIHKNTKFIGSAFLNCTKIRSILVPEGVVYIEPSAFSSFIAGTDISYAGTKDQWYVINFSPLNYYQTKKIYCKDGMFYSR